MKKAYLTPEILVFTNLSSTILDVSIPGGGAGEEAQHGQAKDFFEEELDVDLSEGL